MLRSFSSDSVPSYCLRYLASSSLVGIGSDGIGGRSLRIIHNPIRGQRDRLCQHRPSVAPRTRTPDGSRAAIISLSAHRSRSGHLPQMMQSSPMITGAPSMLASWRSDRSCRRVRVGRRSSTYSFAIPTCATAVRAKCRCSTKSSVRAALDSKEAPVRQKDSTHVDRSPAAVIASCVD
jgi:hypothetical protein